MAAIRAQVARRQAGKHDLPPGQHARDDMRKQEVSEIVPVECAEQYRRRACCRAMWHGSDLKSRPSGAAAPGRSARAPHGWIPQGYGFDVSRPIIALTATICAAVFSA